MPAAPARVAQDPVSDFFTRLGEPGRLETFAGQSATLRFDVADGTEIDRWHVTVTDGEVETAHKRGAADAVVHVGRPEFEAMVTGRLNAQAALLRGLLTCSGSMAALMMFQRCLPGPPGSTGHVPPISSETVMAARRPM
jgi:hypothetical protein